MTGLNRAAVVIAVLVAGVLTIARTGEGGVMSSGMVRVSRSVAHGAERTVTRITDAFVRFLEDEDGREVVNVAVSVRTLEGSVQQAGGDFIWRGVVATGEAIEVKGVNGSVIAELASGDEIEVRAEKTSRRSDPDDVHVEVIEHSGGVTICAIYPSSGGRQNTCEPGLGGRNRVRNNDVKVTFYVKVPAGVTFAGRTVNGSVEVNDLASDVTANSVNGDIEITTTGFAEASTVNGSIEAAMGRYDLTNGLSFSTVNGSISLDLPDDVDANVDARWVNGSLEAELPLRLIGRLSRRAAQGVLGEGGPELNLKTVNGSIRIY